MACGAPSRLQPRHRRAHRLAVAAVGDQHRVAHGDRHDPLQPDADQRLALALGAQERVARSRSPSAAPEVATPSRVRPHGARQTASQEPRSDQAAGEGHHREPARRRRALLLHHRVVDRDRLGPATTPPHRGAGSRGRAWRRRARRAPPPASPAACRLEGGKDRRRREEEDAAVPEVAAVREHRRRPGGVGLFHEALAAGAGQGGRGRARPRARDSRSRSPAGPGASPKVTIRPAPRLPRRPAPPRGSRPGRRWRGRRGRPAAASPARAGRRAAPRPAPPGRCCGPPAPGAPRRDRSRPRRAAR